MNLQNSPPPASNANTPLLTASPTDIEQGRPDASPDVSTAASAQDHIQSHVFEQEHPGSAATGTITAAPQQARNVAAAAYAKLPSTREIIAYRPTLAQARNVAMRRVGNFVEPADREKIDREMTRLRDQLDHFGVAVPAIAHSRTKHREPVELVK